MSDLPPAGWYDDPDDPTRRRYWDGTTWTDHRTGKDTPPPPATPTGGISNAVWGTIGAGVAAAIGGLMPWASIRTGFGSGSMAGIEGDGWISLIAGVALAALGILAARRGSRTGEAWLAVVAAAIIAAVGGWHLLGGGIASQTGDGLVGIGAGLALTGIAGLVGGVSALSMVGESKRT